MLSAGLKGHTAETVTPERTAAVMGSGSLPVYATPRMALLMEKTAAESVAPYLAEGETTVGSRLDIRHLSPTPEGMEIRCESELILIDKRRLLFRVEAFDAAGKVGEGEHERFIIRSAPFLEKAKAKKNV